jgi:hypothetical protein
VAVETTGATEVESGALLGCAVSTMERSSELALVLPPAVEETARAAPITTRIINKQIPMTHMM